MQNLKRLVDLSLDKNQIKDISALQNLIKLKNPILWSNPIEDATPIKDLIQKQKEKGMKLLDTKTIFQNNPLKTPPIEVAEQGTEAFLQWFENNKTDSK